MFTLSFDSSKWFAMIDECKTAAAAYVLDNDYSQLFPQMMSQDGQ